MDGYEDWQRFGFDSLAVEAARKHDGELVLVLSASNPEVAKQGLEKYRKTWEASTRQCFGCTVRVEWQAVRRIAAGSIVSQGGQGG